MRKSEINVNTFWSFVKKRYPDARFERWFPDGELHFWPTGEAEKKQKDLGSCYRNDNAALVARTGDRWGR